MIAISKACGCRAVFFFALCLGLLVCPEGRAAEQALEVQGVSRPMYNAQLSFAVPGSIFAIPVQPGQAVKEGDLLMHLDSRAEDSRLALLDSEIASTIKIRTLTTRIEQALLDMERYAGALRKQAATLMEYQHAKLAHSLSILALEEEEFRIEQLKRSKQELLAQRERMYLYAPCDGYVEEILVERGMAVDRNVLALRLVSINPILVELTLPVDKALLLQPGDTVEVTQPGSDTIFPGVVAHVAKIAVLSNRTLKVRVHVSNPGGMPVGLMVNVRFPHIEAGGIPAGSAGPNNNQGASNESEK
ncbi:MAG: efflux RND transporter periplasmic adaptor subunit [Desulfovibrionaceae bacterium]|nr:efflux RND transporter periplasmic adaptor subunit [Desulfovibrionaceae bacterium]